MFSHRCLGCELLPEMWRGPGFPRPTPFLPLSLQRSHSRCGCRVSCLVEFYIEPAPEKTKLCILSVAKPFFPVVVGLVNSICRDLAGKRTDFLGGSLWSRWRGAVQSRILRCSPRGRFVRRRLPSRDGSKESPYPHRRMGFRDS